MSKQKVVTRQVTKQQPSQLFTRLAGAPSDARAEGHAVSILQHGDAAKGEFGLDIAKAPVPQRRYAADECSVVFDGREARLIFAQRCLIGGEFDSALVVRFNPLAITQFAHSMDTMNDPNLDTIVGLLAYPAEELSVFTVKPLHMANVFANLVAVAIASHETCLDFYHASAFAIHKSASHTTLEVEPVVRVDMRTTLFAAMMRKIQEIATQITPWK